MRIGDKIELELNKPPVSQSQNLGKSVIGIITYLDPDIQYGEITINIADYTIEKEDWFGFNYRIEVSNTNEHIYAKTESPYFDFKQEEFLINIIQQNIDNNFFYTRYSESAYFKKLESGTLYNIVTTPNNTEFDPGTLFKIVSINTESGILVCYNHTARNNQRLFPNKKHVFNEDIEVNVYNGISKLNNNNILDFLEIQEDSDSGSEFDSEEELEETKDIFRMKGQIPASEKELTEDQKREKIGMAIREMFKNSKIEDEDIINLIEHVFSSLYTKFNAMKNWEKNLEQLNSENIVPILEKTDLKTKQDMKNFANDQSDESDNEEFDWKTANNEDYNQLDYYQFIEKQLQSLIVTHNSKQFNAKSIIECEQNGLPIVLNPSYIYKNDIIPNTQDSALIKKYKVKSTNSILEKLPPSVQMFSKIYDSIGKNAFSIFNITVENIPNNYLSKIKLIKPKKTTKKSVKSSWTKPSNQKLYIEKHNQSSLHGLSKVPLNPVKIPDKLLNSKIDKSNKVNYDTIKPFINDFVWDNNQIWPRSIVLSHFKNSKQISEIINNFEGTSLNIEDDSYLERLTEKKVFKNSKQRDGLQKYNESFSKDKSISKQIYNDLYDPSLSIFSETIEVWNSSKKISNIVLRSKTQLQILFGGKYVRNAEFDGENPYYFIDIFTGREFLPKHIILQLEANISTKDNEQECLKCLINQWGQEETNTKNIVSIINGDIIGSQDDVHDVYNIQRVNVDVTKQNSYVLSNHLGKDLELYSHITSNGFVDGFIKIFNEFSSHKQYGQNINNSLSIDNYKEPLDEFFKTEADWNSYVSFFSFDELELYDTKIPEKIIKNLVKFSTNLKKTYIAWKKLKKDKTSSKDILAKLSKRLIKEIKNTRKNFEKKLYNNVGLYIASYIYSKIAISHEARIKIILNTFAFNSETNKSLWAKDNSLIEESKIITHARNKWNYSSNIGIQNNNFTYSYKSNIGVFKKLKKNKRSNIIISKKIKTIIPIIPKISFSKNAINIDTYDYSKEYKIIHQLGNQWTMFKDNKLSVNKMEWAQINNDENLSKEIIELQYKGLVNNLFTTLLKETPNEKFRLPEMWKVLGDKGHLEKIRNWLSNTYNVSYYLNNLVNFKEFIQVVRDDIIDFRKYVSTNSIVSWKKTWLHLIQHLLHEMDTLDLAFSDYRIVLESVVTYLIENEEIISGRNIIMTKSIVEDAHAIAEEDEASGFFGQSTNKDDQKTNREDSKRNLGRFKEGLRTQFDIKTVLASNDTYSDNIPSHNIQTFDSDYSQNFDDDDGDI
tara:strand:- start:11459 stop:15310 length:3852 start_codon:yes stop_codon:yes gene_type:complete